MTTDPTTPEGHAELLSEGRALLRCFNRAPQMTEAEVDAAEAWYSWQLDNGEALLDALDDAECEIERQRGDLVIEGRRANAAEAALAEARQTNARLNRRCQEAEQAAAENVEVCARKGQSMGRGLANYAARMYLERAEAAEAALAEAQETIRGYEGAIEGLSATIGEHRAQLEKVRDYAQLLRNLAHDHRYAEAPYIARIYDEVATALERILGDRT